MPTATYQTLKDLISEETLATFNEFQIERLLTIADSPAGSNAIKAANSVHDSLMDLIIALGVAELNKDVADQAKEGKWIILGVACEEAPFAYTVAATAICGAELIYQATTSIADTVLNGYMCMIKNGELTLEEALEVRSDIFPDGWRSKLVEVPMENVDELVRVRHGKVTKVYQVLLPDTENVLPDEPGYNFKKCPQQIYLNKFH